MYDDEMIIKEKEGVAAGSKRLQAGIDAELQMAHYLKRRYGDDPSVRVFNDLRIVRDDEAAQMDHLLLHKHGLIIIESKSVSCELHINAHGEFHRKYGRKKEGIDSPIEQAIRQGDLLRGLLIDHKERLRKKYLFGKMQGGFKYCPVNVLAAISRKAVITGSRKAVPELHKADQITGAIDDIIEHHRRASKLTTKYEEEWGLYTFTPDEIERVTQFLLDRHTPLEWDKPEEPE